MLEIERDLGHRFPQVPKQPRICEITDARRVEAIFAQYRPEVVIHAAAHKHVPLMELNPGEAIKNNCLGTQTVADVSDRHSATNFVLTSADKAVNPTSITGASKRIAEIALASASS